MEHELQSYELLLASGSPRRAELLKELGIPFRVVEAGHAEEDYPPDLEGGAIALYLAECKSAAYQKPLGGREILLTADTVVWHRGKDLGKPAGFAEAVRMLRNLSGDTHRVFTGVCLRTAQKSHSFCAATEVTFSALSDREIETYVSTCRPYDKAGAYGIQEWIGYIAVEEIRGCYFNVIGLPVQRVYSELKQLVKT